MLLVTDGEQPGRAEYAFLIINAIAPALGGILILASRIPSKGVALLLGLTSGFFLFTATGHPMPEAHRHSHSLTVSISIIGGVVFIALAIGLVTAVE
jgi:zinc and cadmium transporter